MLEIVVEWCNAIVFGTNYTFTWWIIHNNNNLSLTCTFKSFLIYAHECFNFFFGPPEREAANKSSYCTKYHVTVHRQSWSELPLASWSIYRLLPAARNYCSRKKAIYGSWWWWSPRSSVNIYCIPQEHHTSTTPCRNIIHLLHRAGTSYIYYTVQEHHTSTTPCRNVIHLLHRAGTSYIYA